MKINQIINEKSHIDPDIIDALIDKGYTQIGQGVDQTAFLEPETGLVLKIFGTQDNARAPNSENSKPKFSRDQKMFFTWAKYCNDNSSNPYLPKFSGFESFYWNSKVYLQIRQELLFKLDKITAMLCREMARYATAEYDFDRTADFMSSPEYWHQGAWDHLVNTLGSKGLRVLYKTIDNLDDIANQMRYELDLHQDNFMARADGTPVIVDPWVV